MAFVLVQHLDPDHPSALTQLLALKTTMPVIEVTNGVTIEPNKIYVIPQNTSMTIAKRVLRLQPRGKNPGARLPIDHFLESLAQDQQERAIGVILSGSATDGTQGLEMIKSEGGITFAQDGSAKFDSMPRSAEAAGCVDFVLSPEGIAQELAKISKHPLVATGQKGPSSPLEVFTRKSKSPTRAAGKSAPVDQGDRDPFGKILLLLRNQYGVDFSLYKPNTIQRRIARRILLGHHDGMDRYAQAVKGDTKELNFLYSDLLIGVTSFFRNPEAFEFLKERVFPALLKERQRREDTVRVWVVGCSTGQEAYSIAMAYNECCDDIPRAPKLQLFATDLNDSSLEKARRGLYQKGVVTSVSPERLKRFFSEEEGGYRIHKSLRDSCVFARHNVLSDPPFSRMDLVSCRNVMIYIELELQKRILPNFHYALKPGGFLFLGASESIGTCTRLFEAVDRKNKLYSRKPVPAAFNLAPKNDAQTDDNRPSGRYDTPESRLPITKGPPDLSRDFRAELDAQRIADRVASNQFAPPGVLVDSDLQILQFRGATGAYLESPSGKASFDLLKMARPGLMLPLRAAVNKAKKENKTIRTTDVRVSQNGKSRRVNIEVIPLQELKERVFLICFNEPDRKAGSLPDAKSQAHQKSTSPGRRKEENVRLRELETELAETRAYLRMIQEQHESTNEELQAANEEAQSANEELQSSNEELETSKEELESTNEELTTVNEEMASRHSELSHLNSDLINLQTSTKLAIVLLGRDLTIRRFSPQAEKQFDLTLSDIGRNISGLRHNLEFPKLAELITEVIDGMQERDCEVRDKGGRWFSLRVRPYVTVDKRVDGAIVVLVDIDELKKKEALLTETRGHAESIIQTIPDPLLVLNENLRIHSVNNAFYRAFKLSAAEIENHSIFELPSWDIPRLRAMLEEVIPRNSFFNDFEVQHKFDHIGARTLLINARPLNHGSGTRQQILVGIRDITEVLAFQVQLRRSELRYRRLFEAANDGVLLIDPATRKIVAANPFIADLLGYTREELSGKELFEVGLLKDRAASEAAFRQLHANGRIRYEDLPLQTKTGQKREVEFVSNLYTEDGEKIIQCNIRDITERKLAEQKFCGLMESAPDAMIISDHEGKITIINAQTEKVFGYSRGELIGKTIEILIPPRFRGDHAEHRRNFLAESDVRTMGSDREILALRKDGTEFPIEITLSPMKTEFGKVAIAAVRDVTERKKSEVALHQSEERYRTLFGSIDEGFCVIEMLFDENLQPIDFTFLEVNPSFEKQTGILDASGKRMREIDPTVEKHWLDTYGAVALTGHPVRFVQESKGLNRWFDVYAFRLGQPEDRKVAILFTNITERKKAEEELRQAQKQLADRADQLEHTVAARTSELTRTNKQLETFIYSIAHDLRAPLRSMQGFSEMLVEEADASLSASARDCANRISTSAQVMDAILRDLIAFSGIAEQQIELVPLDLQNLVKLALASLEKQIEETNATVEVAADLPDVLGHDPTLGPVLVHLIANAIRFVDPNVRPIVRLHAEPRGEMIRVWVEDNGIGIDAAHQGQIFKLFTRLHGEKYGGTGAGLAMVKKGIERMGGQVGVESAPGGGSRFWFELRKSL
jgi:two-component system CheB/CheR fusion protein